MLLRSFFVVSMAALLASGVQAQTDTPSVSVAPVPVLIPSIVLDKDIRKLPADMEAELVPVLPAKIIVSFTGAQKEHFAFEESAGPSIQEGKLHLVVVGSGKLEMGSRRISTEIFRETLNPDMFHIRVMTGSGGVLNTSALLKLGKEETFTLKGGLPTKVTVTRMP